MIALLQAWITSFGLTMIAVCSEINNTALVFRNRNTVTGKAIFILLLIAILYFLAEIK